MAILDGLPQPLNFTMWLLAIGLAYDWTVKGDTEPWDTEDFIAVFIITWFARKFVG